MKNSKIHLGFENFEVIKTEEDAKIFVETMENIPKPNDKLKKAFRDFNKQKIVGYRLKPHINRYMVDGILKNAMPIWSDKDKSVYFIKGHVAGSLVAKMKELQVLDLWFTPIYENEEIKSDWVKQQHLDSYYKEGVMSDVPKQETLEKYSERFNNKENEVVDGIFNPENWGRRVVKQETLEEAAERILNLSELDGFRDFHLRQELHTAFICGVKYEQKTKDRIMSETSKETKQKAKDYGNSLVTETETLEQACNRIRKELDYSEFDYTSFKLGAKWQQERMYSEEDLEKAYKDGGRNEYDFINKYHCKARISFDKWFEKFKKK